MAYGDRKSERVGFSKGVHVQIMGIDGTWRRECSMSDVSQTGALLTFKDSINGLDLKEFFLLLSATGLAYRRCELMRVNGNEIGVRFVQGGVKKAAAKAAPKRQAEAPPETVPQAD